MSDLLELAVAAHGGLARWNRFRTLQVRMAIRGAIFETKRIAGLQDDVTYETQIHEERVTVDRFGGPNRRLRFLPYRLTLESFEGDIIEARDNPRTAFRDHNADSPWDALHLGYFSSYALWTYLILPFLYTYPVLSLRRLRRGGRRARSGGGSRRSSPRVSPAIHVNR